jgi:dipeptidyl-peptidase-4
MKPSSEIARYYVEALSASVLNAAPDSQWLPREDRFWYRRQQADGGWSFRLRQAEGGEEELAFDHEALSSLLASVCPDDPVHADRLALERPSFRNWPEELEFSYRGRRWRWHRGAGRVSSLPELCPPDHLSSPCGGKSVTLTGGNLWLHRPGAEPLALTSDASPGIAYGKDPDCNLIAATQLRHKMRQPPMAIWSPDGRWLVSMRLYEADLRTMDLLDHLDEQPGSYGQPIRLAIAAAGDERIARQQLVLIDTHSGEIRDLSARLPVFVISMIQRGYVWWDAGSSDLFWLEDSRSSDRLTLVHYDIGASTARVVCEETSETFVDASLHLPGLPNVRTSLRHDRVIWFSQKSGWGHLYLYELSTGRELGAITGGDWLVNEIHEVDFDRGLVWFTALGREGQSSPLHASLMRADFDGEIVQLSPSGRHVELRSPPPGRGSPARASSGLWWLATAGDLRGPPESVILSEQGGAAEVYLRAELPSDLAHDWQWPRPFARPGADGKELIHGALWLPPGFDPAKSYPVLDIVYAGPQRTQVPPMALAGTPMEIYRFALALALAQAMAAAGAVVVMVDGQGTPQRSKAFHDACFDRFDNPGGLNDHVAVLRGLLAEHPFMDHARVGILGHSAGAFAVIRALSDHGDLYRAGVAVAGAYDFRNYNYGWTEKYSSFHRTGAACEDLSVLREEVISQIRAPLLVLHGDLDENTHLSQAVRLIDLLQRAGVEHEFCLIPRANHIDILNRPWPRAKIEAFVRLLAAADFPDPQKGP